MEYRHECEKSYSTLFVLCFLCVFMSAAALGTLRLYGLYLEHRISETAGRIEASKELNLEMSKKYSELLSPARIYSYAREKLGMSNAENVKTIKIGNSAVMTARASVYQTESGESSFWDYINPFVMKAHAKD